MSRHRSEARRRGEQARDVGMALAADPKQRAIAVHSIAFLESMLRSDDLTATTDDAVDDLFAAFEDGGKWRGPMVRRMASRGTILKVGYAPSCRTFRHAGTIAKWQGKDRPTVIVEIARFKAWLAANPEPVDDRRVGQLELWPENCDPNKKTDPAAVTTESVSNNSQHKGF